jgi:hypothetical protein
LAASIKVMGNTRTVPLRMTLGADMHFSFIEALNECMNERMNTYYVLYNVHVGMPGFYSPYRNVVSR